MSFTSPLYYIFLALSLFIYINVPLRYRSYLLLASSYIFYISFNPRFIIFILITTVVSFFCAQLMASSGTKKIRKLALFFAVSVELFLLTLTKYWNPLAQSTNFLSPIDILVPLGISFYTFQSMGYLFDVYRNEIKAESSFPKYALFLSFFPHLLAGPIEPAQNFLPQISADRIFNSRTLSFGVMLILFGLFKKLVIADNLSTFVKLVFNNPNEHYGLSIAVATILARYQIYCDFSGYTDIALGSAMMFGFKLTPNFNRPFFSTSITEYWKRWHISLSNWIKNYIFYPLITTPASRLGLSGLIIITFLILGLWHGLTYNFILYGLIQGTLIAIDAKTKKIRQQFYIKTGIINFPRVLNFLCILVTFFFIIVPPTIFFWSNSFSTSMILVTHLFEKSWSLSDLTFISQNYSVLSSLAIAVLGIVIMEFVDWIHKTKFSLSNFIWEKSQITFYFITAALLIVIIICGKIDSDSNFIYMRF